MRCLKDVGQVLGTRKGVFMGTRRKFLPHFKAEAVPFVIGSA